MIRAGSLFSGIAAPEYAAPQFDWRWSAETDSFASAALSHHYPEVPNLGDVNGIDTDAIEPVDLIVFGSPCQSFSVAGKRLGLDDPRGNMALVGLRVVGRVRPRWVVWENVPGALSSDEGRDFGTFLGLLGKLGYGFAYRVLDAQHFGVPQRRRRVFVVGHLGDWRPAAAVLFEPESLRGDTAPRRETRERIALPVTSRVDRGGEHREAHGNNLIARALRGKHNMALREDADTLIAFSAKDHGADAGEIAPTLRAGTHHRSHANAGVMPAIARSLNAHPSRIDGESETFIANTLAGYAGRNQIEQTYLAHSLRADGLDAGEDGTGRGTPLVPINSQIAFRHNALGRGTGFGVGEDGDAMFTLSKAHSHAIGGGMSVRRLTPRECERLQGFPDDYTLVPYRGKPAADGPRYRAIGNSMAVPVVRWILGRIA